MRRKPRASEPGFDDPEAARFVRLLVTNWEGPGYDEMIRLLERIAAGEVDAEFALPVSTPEPGEWLGIGRPGADTASVRETRLALIQIAKADSVKYRSRTSV